MHVGKKEGIVVQVQGKEIKHALCLGIGGVGVGPIAECLLGLGIRVTGYDAKCNAICDHLTSLGVTIATQLDDALLAKDVDAVVHTSAIAPDHMVLQAARDRGILVMRRAEMLAELLQWKKGIAVAGTHGKTTTSALLAYVLYASGLDPSWVVGGKLHNTDSYMRWSDGEHLVVEADESDGSLICLRPNVAILTNCESDHLINFSHDYSQLRNLFADFLAQLPDDGYAVVNMDDAEVAALATESGKKVVGFGFGDSADYQASSYKQQGLQATAQLKLPDGEVVTLQIALPGKHNIYNALAAFVSAHQLGVSSDRILQALAAFSGVGRRFTICGEYCFDQGCALLVNDYGHHPTEVMATVQAARASYPDRRLVIAFQPHRFSRTADCFDAFVSSLAQADVLLLLDTFSAGEKSIDNMRSADLAIAMRDTGHQYIHHIGGTEQLIPAIHQHVRDGDLLILQGAGSVGYMVDQLSTYKQKV